MIQQPPSLTEMLAAKLEPEADYAESRNGPYVTALTALRAENARLREALEDIVLDCEAEYPPSHGAIKYACKMALGDTHD